MELIHGDCLEEMQWIESGSVDLVLADPPYGTTACKWDSVIDFDKMWEQLNRVIKPNRPIVMTASQPFTSALIMSNIKKFKYCWIWNKKISGNPLNAKRQPLRITEDVVVFNTKTYDPIMRTGKLRKKGGTNKQPETVGKVRFDYSTYNDQYYPTVIIEIPHIRRNRVHPTQKPVALMEYLIRTYSNERETVLDLTMGSGTTGIAAVNLNRNFIGIEEKEKYYKIACQRIENAEWMDK